ncbi:MAG: CHASE domain-containing protein [Vicinamibacterales bacterium]
MTARAVLRRELIPYLILLTALLATAGTARYAYESGVIQGRYRFERVAELVHARVTNRIDSYVAMLLGGAGLFAASDDVTREEFASYVSRLGLARRYPGIQGIGFSRLVRPHERGEVLAIARRAVPEFRFWPEPAAGDTHAILFLEPLDVPNRHALGYDMSSETTRNDAMIRARDSGAPAASGKVRLVQEEAEPGRDQAGFLIYVPIYFGGMPANEDERRARFRGFVYSPFRADDLLHGILAADLPPGTGLEIFDQPNTGAVDESRLLHRAQPTPEPGRHAVRLPVDVVGREWTMIARTNIGMLSRGDSAIVALIALGGTLLSVLVFLITRSLVIGRVRAERKAEELRISEERLRAADHEKEAFLATVSHELRTPLNAIMGWASMLGRPSVSAEMQAHAINVIKRNAAAQTRLIEDLLDMSRAVAGHLNLNIADVDARAVLDAAADAIRPAAEQAGLTLHLDVGTRLGIVEADPGRLQQIVMNLLSNSIKFTPRGGHIDLHAQRHAGVLTIRVTDTGIGIDPEFLPFLFDRFKQADSSPTRQHSGAGLGLAIVRHLVELHGGKIECVSAGKNAGATFTARLPTSRRRKGI